ncbi:MAG: endonuclease III, partial [Anaerobacillus sp.]
MLTKVQIRTVLDTMEEMFPDAHCELNHSNPFELAIAVVLSAQCTDALVNKVTPGLFEKYRQPEDFLDVPLEELENDIRRIGLFRNKAKSIKKLARTVVEEYDGSLPETQEKLMELAGVGRKTAN